MKNLLWLIVCLCGVSFTCCGDSVKKLKLQAEEPKPQAVSVTCQTVKTSTVVDASMFFGLLQSDLQAIIEAGNEGNISQILVNPGESVTAGTAIFLLNTGSQIQAPISGVIAEISVNLGEFVTKGQKLTTIVNNKNLNLNIYIPTEYFSKLKIGLPVEIIDSYDSQGNVSVTSRIKFISPEVSQDRQTTLVKALIRNDGSFRNNQHVKARVIWNQKPGILIPVTSVSRLDGQTIVFIVEEQEKENREVTTVAKQKILELGAMQANQYQVVSGLKVGEELITSQILNLTNGIPIKCINNLSDG